MKRYNHYIPKREDRAAGEYCSAACGNADCPLNLSRCAKGERFTVRPAYRTKSCRGYVSAAR